MVTEFFFFSGNKTKCPTAGTKRKIDDCSGANDDS